MKHIKTTLKNYLKEETQEYVEQSRTVGITTNEPQVLQVILRNNNY